MIKFVLLWMGVPMASWAWGAKGHQLIAELALTKLTPSVRQNIQHVLQAEHTDIKHVATWMDDVRRQKQFKSLARLHFMNIPFGERRYFPKHRYRKNALSAIIHAKTQFIRPGASSSEKLMALRILFHVIADIHQPLHTISLYSKRFPYGDRGGNLYPIPRLNHFRYLHPFWDEGGGFLSHAQLKEFSVSTCPDDTLSPSDWIQDSYRLATTVAYLPPGSQSKMPAYQKKVKIVAKKQIEKAACHLAAYLNTGTT